MSTAEGVQQDATAASSDRRAPSERRRPWPSVPVMGLHIAALWTLSFVQPLFDLLGKNAAFFVARDNTPGDILILALGFTLLPPLLATLVLALVSLVSRAAARWLHLAILTVLGATIVLQVIKGLSGSAAVLFPLSLLLGAGLVTVYARSGGLRTFVSVLGVAPVVVIALLLVFSPVGDLVFRGDGGSGGSASAKVASGAAPRTPVVLMVFDELPSMSLMKGDQSLDRQRYPNFARLADSSTWYRNATSVSDGTYVAVPAILTGLRPKAELPTSRSYPRNLFTLFGKQYDIHAEEPITHVCPETLCRSERTAQSQGTRLKSLARDLRIVEGRLLLPDDLADDLPAIDRDWEDFAAEAGDDGLAEAAGKDAAAEDAGATGGGGIRVAGNDLPSQRVRAGRAVVRTMKPGNKPGLWMVHYVIPHVPWRFLPDGSQYVVDGPTMPGLDDQTWERNQGLLDLAWQRHFLMMRFADRLLGDAIDQMKATGLWDKALVMVVADHGGDISPGGSRRPVTKQNFAAVAGVPMFVKLPGQKTGAVSDTFTTTMDVVPTVIKQLGIRSSWKLDGIPVDEPHPAKLLQQRNGRTAKLVGVTPQTFLEERKSYLARQVQLFPPGLRSIWRTGPRADLLGTAASTLSASRAVSGTIDNARLYRRVRPRSGVIPAYVTGTVKGIPAGTDVAVAVNGKVRASGRLYKDGGDLRFSVLVPPETLKRGANRVDVYALRGGSARLVATSG